MPLSIFIFGNTNNYLYILAEGFRALGHNVRLVINRKDLLHRPESLNPDWSNGYPEWITDCSHLTDFAFAFESYEADEMFSTMAAQADFAILNDIGPSLTSYLSCPFVSVLTGSDLTYSANFHSVEIRTAVWDQEFRKSPHAQRLNRKLIDMVARQREGLLNSRVVAYAARGLSPDGDKLLDAIGVTDAQRMMIYLSDTLRVAQQPMPNNSKLKIFCGSRVTFKQNAAQGFASMDLKGIDILIDGFALYCSQGGTGTLHLPKKGSDISAAQMQIIKLGVESQVKWYEDMPLYQFERELISADLVCDQFGSSFPGMVTTHAYALGRPVLANFRKESMPFDLPGLDAHTPDEVCNALLYADSNRKKLVDLGLESRHFAENYLSSIKTAQLILKHAMDIE